MKVGVFYPCFDYMDLGKKKLKSVVVSDLFSSCPFRLALWRTRILTRLEKCRLFICR